MIQGVIKKSVESEPVERNAKVAIRSTAGDHANRPALGYMVERLFGGSEYPGKI